MQCFFGAGLCTFVTENTFSSIFSFAGFFVDLHIHGTDSQTLATVNALILITVDA